MPIATTGKSFLTFGDNGHLLLSENGNPAKELAARHSEQSTYTISAPSPDVAPAIVRSVFVNRAGAKTLEEIYCEVDSGQATINLFNNGVPILSSDLKCDSAGASTTEFNPPAQNIGTGQKLDHKTLGQNDSKRIIVVIKYSED